MVTAMLKNVDSPGKKHFRNPRLSSSWYPSKTQNIRITFMLYECFVFAGMLLPMPMCALILRFDKQVFYFQAHSLFDVHSLS